MDNVAAASNFQLRRNYYETHESLKRPYEQDGKKRL